MDYYDILDISKESTDEQIRKAYYKLSLKWHPDKNIGTDTSSKFKEISEAYQVLSNRDTRMEYDSYGTMSGIFKSPGDLFTELFSNFDPKLNKFLSSTLSDITHLIIDSKDGNLWNIINNINHTKIIDESGDVMKHLLKNTLSNMKRNIKHENVFTLTLNQDDIEPSNNINISLEFCRKYTHIFLVIKTNDGIINHILDLEYDEHYITIHNEEFCFDLIDKLPEGYIRHNIHDIVLEYNLNIKYKDSGIFLDNIYDGGGLNVNILFSNESNIVKIPNKGLLNNNIFGDLYIIFKFALKLNTEELLPKTGYAEYETIDPYSMIK